MAIDDGEGRQIRPACGTSPQRGQGDPCQSLVAGFVERLANNSNPTAAATGLAPRPSAVECLVPSIEEVSHVPGTEGSCVPGTEDRRAP